MKRLFFTLILLSVAVSLFAGNQADKPLELYVCGSAGKGDVDLIAINEFQQQYPDTKLTFNSVDVSTGAPITITALLAAGTPPDVYIDYMARSGRYLDPDFAQEIPPDIYAPFDPVLIGQLKRKGVLYGLPQSVRLLSMFVNMSLLDSLSVTVDNQWTTDDFIKLCRTAAENGIQPYTFFAANQSSTEWLLGWFPAFGVEYFAPGDYSKTTIRTTGGEKVFQWILDLYNAGYIPENAPIMSDDDCQAMILSGQVLTSGTYICNWDKNIASAVEQGLLDKPFEYTYVTYPRAPGVNKVPLLAVYPLVIPHKSGNTERDRQSLAMAAAYSSVDLQNFTAVTGFQYQSRMDATEVVDDPYVKTGTKLKGENGMYNFGASLPCYGEIRASLYPRIQALLTGQETPLQAIVKYEAAINEALKR